MDETWKRDVTKKYIGEEPLVDFLLTAGSIEDYARELFISNGPHDNRDPTLRKHGIWEPEDVVESLEHLAEAEGLYYIQVDLNKVNRALNVTGQVYRGAWKYKRPKVGVDTLYFPFLSETYTKWAVEADDVLAKGGYERVADDWYTVGPTNVMYTYVKRKPIEAEATSDSRLLGSLTTDRERVFVFRRGTNVVLADVKNDLRHEFDTTGMDDQQALDLALIKLGGGCE